MAAEAGGQVGYVTTASRQSSAKTKPGGPRSSSRDSRSGFDVKWNGKYDRMLMLTALAVTIENARYEKDIEAADPKEEF